MTSNGHAVARLVPAGSRIAEAFTWVGLLIGMYFKYLGTPRTELGVHDLRHGPRNRLHRVRGGTALL